MSRPLRGRPGAEPPQTRPERLAGSFTKSPAPRSWSSRSVRAIVSILFISGTGLFRPLLGFALGMILMAGPFCTAVLCLTVASAPVPELILAEGKKHYDAGNHEAARESWSSIFSDPFYGPACMAALARAHEAAGDHARTEAMLQDLLKRYPNNAVFREFATRLLADTLARQGRPEARKFLAEQLKSAAERNRPALLLQLADLERRLGDYQAALPHYRTLYLKYPATAQGLKAAEDMAWIVSHAKMQPQSFSAQEQADRGNLLFQKGRFDLAAEIYEAMLKDKPSDLSIRIKLGRCHFKDRQYHKAIAALKGMLEGQVPEKDRLEALHILSLVYWRLEREKEFEQCCNQMLAGKLPEKKQKALFNLAAYNLEKRRFDKAQAYFDRLLKSDPDASSKNYALWKTAWIKYFNRAFTQAADSFKEIRRTNSARPLTNASKYWQARSLMEAGRAKDAQPVLEELAESAPLDYYGLEAARLLAKWGTTVSVKQTPVQRIPDLSLTSAQRSTRAVACAEKLMEHGLYESALLTLETLPKAQTSAHPIAFLTARAAYGCHRYRQAQEIMQSVFGQWMDNPPPDAAAEFVELAFPRVHLKEAFRLARVHSVDPYLVWAIIRQESRYDASAVSSAGALGLMQVTPAAAGFGTKRGKPASSAVAEILEPGKNLSFGIRILARNLETFKGRLVPALASYNADIRQVKVWVQRNGKLKQDEFIESIPYKETRDYVKKVLANYRNYSRLHKQKDLAGL